MNNIFIALGGGMVGFALSLLVYKRITLRMLNDMRGITHYYILPLLKDLRHNMRILHYSSAKDYSSEMKKLDILIAKAEEFSKSRKNII